MLLKENVFHRSLKQPLSCETLFDGHIVSRNVCVDNTLEIFKISSIPTSIFLWMMPILPCDPQFFTNMIQTFQNLTARMNMYRFWLVSMDLSFYLSVRRTLCSKGLLVRRQLCCVNSGDISFVTSYQRPNRWVNSDASHDCNKSALHSISSFTDETA